MKIFFLLSVLLCVTSLSANGEYGRVNSEGTDVAVYQNEVSFKLTTMADIEKEYAVIASTRKSWGEQYALNCVVEATCYGQSCSIFSVKVATSEGYVKVNHTSDWAGGYMFTYKGETYYFDF